MPFLLSLSEGCHAGDRIKRTGYGAVRVNFRILAHKVGYLLARCVLWGLILCGNLCRISPDYSPDASGMFLTVR